jgi:hypothetical protein
MRSRNRFLIQFCLALTSLWSCSGVVNHFVDPVSMPIFTAPGQGEIQVNYTSHSKFYIEGAYALPYQFAIVAKHTSWQHNLANDQSMSSVAAGKFWTPGNGSMFMLLGGYGVGSQRFGPNYQLPDYMSNSETSLDGSSDFRKYFFEALFAERDSINLFGRAQPPLLNSWGVAARVESLNQYRFNQIAHTRGSYDPTIPEFTYSSSPQHNSAIDLACFTTFGMGFLELYGEAQIRFTSPFYTDYVDHLVFTCGLRFSF